LKNTEYVYGITVFTGHDSKVMMNSTQAKYKFSKLEILVNSSMFIVFGLQLILALIAAFVGTAWITSNNKEHWLDENCYTKDKRTSECDNAFYVMYNANKIGFISLFGTWILIFTNFVPISLMVTLEMVKLGQAIMMQNELMMYDDEQDMQMRAQASNLNEELGQVEYVFSDKTGTLTCNVMQFKKFTAGKWAYGKDALPAAPQEDNVCFEDPSLAEVLNEVYSEQKEALLRVLIFLSCCHTIIIDQKKGRYNSSSPDELALVNAAKQFGYEFKDRDENDNIVILDRRNNTELRYQLLNICEFTSTRKR
jgi:phospholipid-transporting ATPase